MAADPRHGHIDPDVQGVHIPFQFTFPNAASRTGAPASLLAGGASKLALQGDNFSLWMLSSVSPTPTWVQVGAGNTGAPASAAHVSFSLSSTGNWNNRIYPVWQAPRGASVNILQVDAATSGGTSLALKLQKRSWGSLPTNGTDLFLNNLAATPSGVSLTSFSASRLNPRDHVVFVGASAAAESGSVQSVHITMYYGQI